MSILTNPDTPVFSLDIETTSLDHKKSRVWAVGAASKNYEKEFLQQGVVGSKGDPTKALIGAHKAGGAGDFGTKQASNGAFSAFTDAFNSKSLVSMNKTLTDITNNLKNNAGVFLVQNLPFESTAFAEGAYKKGGQRISSDVSSNFLKEVFGIDSELYKNSKTLIPEDSRIQAARKELYNSSQLFKHSGNFSQETITNFRGDLEKTSSALFKTLNSVVEENLKRGPGYSTAIDLMDVSKIYSSKLAVHGGIGAGYLNTGLSVDYLAKNLLGVPEKHTALSDARQQRQIFEILTRRIEDIDKNGLSDLDKSFGSDLMSSDVHDRTFVKNIENRLTESINKSKEVKARDLNRLLSKSLGNYSTIPETATFNRLAFAEEIRKTFLKDPSEAFTRLGEVKDANFLPEIKALSVPDESPILRSGKNTNAKVLMGMTALGVVAMVGSTNRQSKKEDLTSYDDLYENVYLGQQYANWQERNNSHKMIY